MKADFEIIDQIQQQYLKRRGMSSSNSQYYKEKGYAKRPYRKLSAETRQLLIKEVFQNKHSIIKAAGIIGINVSTAKVIIKKYRMSLKNETPHQNLYKFQNQCGQNFPSSSACLPSPQPLPVYFYIFNCNFGTPDAYLQPYAVNGCFPTF